ncbi:MAG TPA: glycosyltransferase family 9 protein [Acetobacteraceae bacterium]
MKNILVLKLGALGNVVLSLGAFAAIRQHHPDAQITLLTTTPYAGWMAGAPWFDRVLIDARPAWWDLSGVLCLRRLLHGGKFGRVYDLQTSGRSSHYFRLFPRGAQPEWSGIAPGCSHPDRDPDRDRLHDVDRLRGQLHQAGIPDMPPADLSWCCGDISRFGLPRPFALLVPGSSPHRPVKRWPAEHYRALAAWLARQGIAPVVIGAAGEHMLADRICAGTAITQGAGPQGTGARDLTGQTGFGDLADLGRAATIAIGNDTGPMHLLAAAGCPSLVLFSGDSDPARCAPVAPPGAPGVRVLRRDDLATLTPEDVTAEALNIVQATMPATAEAPA